MNTYLIIILSILAAQLLFKCIIEGLNLINLQKAPPDELKELYLPEKYQRSQEYLKDKTWLDLIESGATTSLLIVLILTGFFNTLDLFARNFGFGEIGTGLIYFGLLILGYMLFELPSQIYYTFVIEEKYGFNKTTPKTFILDHIKQLFLTTILGGLALAGILWIFETAGTHAWLYCWIALIIFQFALMYIAPTWIMPLFNKFSPLTEGELKDSIEDYAKKQAFALKGVYTMDGSQRSTKSNAFFTGFGKNRRVVLFDTLIANHSIKELVSILAHEIGHYKHRHILKFQLWSILNSGLMLFLLSWFIKNPGLFQAFGMEHLSIYASLVFFGILYSPIQTALSILLNAFSRKFEYQADAFAVNTYNQPESMVTALKKLSSDNLTNLTPHPWKVLVSYSHPTLLQRIRAINLLNNDK
jgi:STE24 endopeptidase